MILSEQEIIRRQAREQLLDAGIDPYPSDSFDVNVTAADIHEHYEQRKTDYKDISIAGRLMKRSIMGLVTVKS